MATAGRVWEVLAVRYGTLEATCGRLFFRWSDYGEPDAEQRLDFYFWVLRGDGETVLVDTGFDPEVAERRGRTPLCPPREAFARLAVTPSRVIVTHFHYDHVGNLSAFPDAQVWIPGRELEFWTSEPARRLQFAEHVEQREIAHLVERHRAGRAVTYGDGDELAPGVTAVALPGHSPGQHGVLVRSASGPVLLASDAVHLYRELEQERPFGVIADLVAMYESYARVRTAQAQGALFVPGHDPLVAARHPAVAGSDGLAIRLA